MPFLDDSLANERIEETQKKFNYTTTSVLLPKNPGHGRTYTFNEKVMIGTLARIDGTRPTARALDIDGVTANSYAHGKNGNNASAVNPELKSKIDGLVENFRDRLAGKACERIEKVFDTLDDARIEGVSKATDLASIAYSLANVTQKLSPILNKQDGNSQNVHFHFFRPRTKNEDEYEIINVDKDDRVERIG